MTANTKIEWADHTFNPWEGCQKVGPGCDHCYAEARNARFAGGTAINWGPGAARRRTSLANWKKPLQWNANAEKFAENNGRRQRVFCASLADVFDNEVDPVWRMDLFQLIAETPNLDWLILTKRIGNVEKMSSGDGLMWDVLQRNVWLGATIVNQEEASRDIPKLLDLPAAKRFLSIEPLLGPIKLSLPANLKTINGDPHGYDWFDPLTGRGKLPDYVQSENEAPAYPKLDWVIVGGESGTGARPMHPEWVRSLRDQCAASGVPFLFKQWGEWAPVEQFDPSGDSVYHWSGSQYGQAKYLSCAIGFDGNTSRDAELCVAPRDVIYKVGKKIAGRLLDDSEWNGFPL